MKMETIYTALNILSFYNEIIFVKHKSSSLLNEQQKPPHPAPSLSRLAVVVLMKDRRLRLPLLLSAVEQVEVLAETVARSIGKRKRQPNLQWAVVFIIEFI